MNQLQKQLHAYMDQQLPLTRKQLTPQWQLDFESMTARGLTRFKLQLSWQSPDKGRRKLNEIFTFSNQAQAEDAITRIQDHLDHLVRRVATNELALTTALFGPEGYRLSQPQG